MELDTVSIDGSSEREEGEIVSDELLEDISDDSISISPSPKTGKLNKHKESLRALSLSSVSDVITVDYAHHEKRKTRKKRKISRHPYRRRSVSDSSDSDREIPVSKRLLKEAIHIDSTKLHNNSLRTRLRGMVAKSPDIIEIDDKTDDLQDIPMSISDSELPEVDDLPVQLDSASEREQIPSPVLEQDDELIQLRLAALKTAVMNKFAHRKKKNGTQDEEPKTSETNKENLNNVNNSPVIEVNCNGDNSDNNVQNSAHNSDEDEDILRAVLLASISKKITNKEPSSPIKNSGAAIPMKNVKTSDKTNTNLTVPKIPRFILSVNNSDSDSDDNLIIKEDIEKERLKNSQSPDIQKEVECEVEKFLKQQRAEVEAKQKPSSKVQTVKPAEKVRITEKNDLYKILPKSKQLEYENLIQKLKSAEKKPRVRKLSNRTQDKNARIKTTKNTDSKTVTVKNNETTLQQTIRQMHIDGRLQIEGKYNVLTPILKKLTEAHQERKKQQLRTNQLLAQLNEARNQCEKYQLIYKETLREFFKRKEEIDKRKTVNIPRQTQTTNFIKKQTAEISLPAAVSVKNPSLIKPKEILRCKIVLEKCPVNLTDPSDIEFKKIEAVDVTTVPKYTSPLDNKVSLNDKINPLEIFCPFEINGSCRDKECSYNHYNLP